MERGREREMGREVEREGERERAIEKYYFYNNNLLDWKTRNKKPETGNKEHKPVHLKN